MKTYIKLNSNDTCKSIGTYCDACAPYYVTERCEEIDAPNSPCWRCGQTDAQRAAKEYIARRDQTHYADGRFDNAGRWYPAAHEKQSCCNAIRTPSKAHPYSYNRHCRTKKHVAMLYKVSLTELNAALKHIAH